MSTLTRETSAWSGEVTQTSSTATYKFETAGKYVDQNIEFTVKANIPSGDAVIVRTWTSADV